MYNYEVISIQIITNFSTSNFTVPVIYLYPELAAFYLRQVVKYFIYSVSELAFIEISYGAVTTSVMYIAKLYSWLASLKI